MTSCIDDLKTAGFPSFTLETAHKVSIEKHGNWGFVCNPNTGQCLMYFKIEEGGVKSVTLFYNIKAWCGGGAKAAAGFTIRRIVVWYRDPFKPLFESLLSIMQMVSTLLTLLSIISYVE